MSHEFDLIVTIIAEGCDTEHAIISALYAMNIAMKDIERLLPGWCRAVAEIASRN